MGALGIDLGTTNTVAVLDGSALAIGDQGARILPSVVAFPPNGMALVGAAARRRRLIDGPNAIFSSKRIIGLRFDDTTTREFRDRYPFELVRTEGDGVAFRTRAGAFTPTDIAALLLCAIHEKTQRIASELAVVLTVPTSFNAAQRSASVSAAEGAGLRGVRLFDEPMATVYAYRAAGQPMRRAAVYDLGGGTFHFSVIDCTRDTPRLVAHGSDPFLGGDDVDHKIAEWVATEVTKQVNWDLWNHAEVSARLLAEAERVKIALSARAETLVELSQVDPECPLAGEGLPLRREVLDRLCEPLVRRTFLTCDRTLRDAGLQPGEIDAVLLAGGSTHLPVIGHGVEVYFGRPGLSEIEPTDVVALGASRAYA